MDSLQLVIFVRTSTQLVSSGTPTFVLQQADPAFLHYPFPLLLPSYSCNLAHFGYLPTLYVPKPSSNPFLSSLLTQCQNLHISLLPSPKSLSDASESLSALKSHLDSETDVVMDALFGFSFKPPVRAPFGEVLKMIGGCGKPIVSVDIPSVRSITRLHA
jgi:hypothetical protein